MKLSPELTVLQAVEREASRRLVRRTPVTLLDYKPSSVIPDTQLAPTGSIAVYVARRNNALMAEVKAATRNTKDGRDRRVMRKVMKQFANRKPCALEDVARRAVSAPVLAELAYGGSTMIKHMFIEDDQFVMVTMLPYIGGPVRTEDFKFTEYYNADDDEYLECVLVRHPPVLSAAEAEAIKIIPPELENVYVGPGDIVANTVLPVVAYAAAEAVFVYVTFNISSHDENMQHISPEAIKSLGPVGTARAMLNLRRDLLKGRVGREM